MYIAYFDILFVKYKLLKILNIQLKSSTRFLIDSFIHLHVQFSFLLNELVEWPSALSMEMFFTVGKFYKL